MKRHRDTAIIPIERIESVILLIRGQRVIVDADLAVLYGVSTRRFNEQVRRNLNRFPHDFMFQLSPQEKTEVVANCDHLHRLKFSPQLPYAFTEHGVIMAANLLRSPKAVKVSVYVVRAFVKLREVLSTHKELAQKLAQLESKLQNHDEQIIALIDAIRELMTEPEPPAKPPIGFVTEERGRKARPRSGGKRHNAMAPRESS
jgi:hypothetical protein